MRSHLREHSRVFNPDFLQGGSDKVRRAAGLVVIATDDPRRELLHADKLVAARVHTLDVLSPSLTVAFGIGREEIGWIEPCCFAYGTALEGVLPSYKTASGRIGRHGAVITSFR